MKYMIDTSVFNRIVDGLTFSDYVPDGAELFVTYVQVAEINQTKDAERRGRLNLTFALLRPQLANTDSFIFGKTPLGLAPLGITEEFDAIKAELDAKNNSKGNNDEDALIAETALKNDYWLITADRDLADVFSKRSSNFKLIET